MRGSVQFHPTEHEGGGPPVASTALPETLQPLPGDGSMALEMLCVRARRLLSLGAPLTDPRVWRLLGLGPGAPLFTDPAFLPKRIQETSAAPTRAPFT